ncbi:Cro/CI family transcriptional regulator [Azotobacter chroococcum]|uniref:Cro/CI family transcriptional regulator n=1 Tax=Azotobacter chroococcum TaxID=353 RepID=UPI0010AE6C6C|nr:Cro/CI family transcriptional regulator [Azotobacter chroococcum]TKD40565.1 helix-turn-helix domain-containing protein [Azotobacter chroococcum]
MKTPIERLVAHFGDQMKTAKELGVTQPAVSQWLSGACRMSAAVAFRAQEKTRGAIQAWELCSDIPRPEAA